MLPAAYNPDNYLSIKVPGFGLIFALITITMIGFMAANLAGRTMIAIWDKLLNSTPVVRSIYKGSKQIFETLFSQSGAPSATYASSNGRGGMRGPSPSYRALDFSIRTGKTGSSHLRCTRSKTHPKTIVPRIASTGSQPALRQTRTSTAAWYKYIISV